MRKIYRRHVSLTIPKNKKKEVINNFYFIFVFVSYKILIIYGQTHCGLCKESNNKQFINVYTQWDGLYPFIIIILPSRYLHIY